MRAYPEVPMNSYIYALVFNGLCRVSVPIFFMISGALLLEQVADFKKNTKRAVKFIVKTVVWTLVFMVWDYFYLGDKYLLRNIFTTPVRNHFWYMYAMIGIYLTVPLWQKLAGGDSKELMRYFAILYIAVMAITFALDYSKIKIYYEVPLVGGSSYVGYFIMGYAIRHYIDEIKIKKWIPVALWMLCVAATTLLTYKYTTKLGFHYETFSDFRSVFIGISAMSVFYLAMKMKTPKPRKWIAVVSKHSFNIYMMHVFFLDILQENIDITKVNAWLGTPVFFIFMVSLSIAMSWLYEKAKGKKKTMI